MKVNLEKELENIVMSTISDHLFKKDKIHQILSYYGDISLVEMAGKDVTLGFLKSGDRGYIFMLTEEISEIKKDFENKKEISPKVIFNIKVLPKKYLHMEPSHMHRIDLKHMSKDFFSIFIKIQEVLYKKVH